MAGDATEVSTIKLILVQGLIAAPMLKDKARHCKKP